MGAEADIIAHLTSRYFRLRAFGEIYGYAFATYVLAGVLGPCLITGRSHCLSRGHSREAIHRHLGYRAARMTANRLRFYCYELRLLAACRLIEENRPRTHPIDPNETIVTGGYRASYPGQLKAPKTLQTKFHSRAALSTLLIFEGFALAITCLFLYAGIVRHAGWGGAIVGLVLCAAIAIWWRAFLVAIDDDQLRYKSLFASEKIIELRNITRAVRKIEFHSKGYRPPIRIEIYGTVEGKEVNFDINVKPFPLADVRKLEQLLNIV